MLSEPPYAIGEIRVSKRGARWTVGILESIGAKP